MQAIRVHQFGGPEELKWESVPDPIAGPGQVVVAVKAVGVNPVETYIRAGTYGPRQFPFTPGQDASGVVETIGEGVTNVSVGDRVYVIAAATGAYAEKVASPANRVFKLSNHLTFEQGAAIGVPYSTAHYGLFLRGGAKTGETVLIHGASGGVGLAAVQLGVRAGLKVLGTAGSNAGREVVQLQGASEVFDHHDPSHFEAAKSAAGGGVPLILEMLANQNLGRDLTILAKFGRVVVIGSRGKVEVDPRDTMARNADIRGMSLMNATDQEIATIHADMGNGFADGSLRPIIGDRFPLKDASAAHEEVMKGDSVGKVILLIE